MVKESDPHTERLDNAALNKLSPKKQFAAHMADRAQFKPKWVNKPGPYALYRLVVREPGNHVYEELPIEDQNCYHLALRPSARQALLDTELPELPEPYHLKTFGYNISEPSQFQPISFRQLYTILHSLSREARWSVTEEDWGIRNHPFLVTVLFEGSQIVGLRASDISNLANKSYANVGFFLLRPEAQGKGLGKYLLAASNQRLLALNPDAKMLVTTSDGCESACQNAAKEFYKRQGYYTKKIYPFTYENYKKGWEEIIPATVPEHFFRDPDTNEVLPRFQAERLERDLNRVAEQLLSVKERGR
jgi:GNAT superfamily N-acetyltransferase